MSAEGKLAIQVGVALRQWKASNPEAGEEDVAKQREKIRQQLQRKASGGKDRRSESSGSDTARICLKVEPRGKGRTSLEVPEAKADRAQGLGHRLRETAGRRPLLALLLSRD